MLEQIPYLSAILLIFGILLEKIQSFPCDFCQTCETEYNQCEADACVTNFSNTEEARLCVSECENGFYWSQTSSQCEAQCGANEYLNDNHIACLSLGSCPEFQEVGQFKLNNIVDFVIPDQANNKIVVAFGPSIQIYNYNDYSLEKSFPKQNDSSFISVKRDNNDIIAVSQGCDRFVWNYQTGLLKDSWNIKEDGACYFLDEAQTTVYGYEGDQFYALNYVEDTVALYNNPSSNITHIAASGNDIYTSDLSLRIKKWNLEDVEEDPIAVNANAFSYDIQKLQVISMSGANYALAFFYYPTNLPGGGPEIYIGDGNNDETVSVGDLSQNILDVVIEQNRFSVFGLNKLILYSFSTISSITKVNDFSKSQKKYQVNNDKAFLIYDNYVEEYSLSGTPDFAAPPDNTYTTQDKQITGVVFDNTGGSGTEKILIFGIEILIINHSDGAILQRVGNFPAKQASVNLDEITTVRYFPDIDSIISGSLNGKVGIFQDTFYGRINDVLDNPSFVNVYSEVDNKVIKVLVDTNYIYVLYQDKKIGIYNIETYESEQVVDLSGVFQTNADVLDMQFDVDDATKLFVNTKDELVKQDITSVGSLTQGTVSSTANDQWSFFHQSSGFHFSCSIQTNVYLWNSASLTTPLFVETLQDSQRPISTVVFDQATEQYLIGTKTGTIIIFDRNGNNLDDIKTFSYEDSPINKPIVSNIIFDAAGTRLVTFHEDGLTIFWNYVDTSASKMITFLKPTEMVKSAVSDGRFFTVLNYYTESEIIEWDWDGNQIFETISKYSKIVTDFEIIESHKQLLIGFEDGSIATKVYEKNITQIETGFTTLNGIHLIDDLQLLLTYTNQIEKFDFPYKESLGSFPSYHLQKITGVEVALAIGGVNYVISYNEDTQKNLAIWNIDTAAQIGDQNGFHSQAVKQVLVVTVGGVTKVISCGIDLNIVLTLIDTGAKDNEITSHSSSLKQIGYYNNILISFDSAQKLFFNDYTTLQAMQPAQTIDQIQGFIIDEKYQKAYVYAYNIFIYDLANNGQQQNTFESSLSSVNVVNKMYIQGDYIFLHDRENIVVKDRVTYENLLEEPISPARIDVQQIIVNLEREIMVVYSQSEGFEEIFVYNFKTGQIMNSLLSSQSLFSGRNYGIILDIENDIIIKLNQSNLIFWDLYQGRVDNFMGYQHETDNIKGAHLDLRSNTVISYDTDKVVFWDYSNYIKPASIELPKRENVSVSKANGSNVVYYADVQGNVYSYDVSTDILNYITQLPVKPKYLISQQNYIVCDQGNDIVLFSQDFQTEHARVSDNTISPIEIMSHPEENDKIFVYTKQNEILIYTISANSFGTPDVNSDHTDKIINCQFNYDAGNNFKHFICYDLGGDMSITSFVASPATVLTGGLISHHGSDPIRGIDILSNKLITYSDQVVVYSTYTPTAISSNQALTLLTNAGFVDKVVNDGTYIYTASGINKIILVSEIASIPALDTQKIVGPCKDGLQVSTSQTYDRLTVFCPFQINVYKITGYEYINTLRKSKEINDIYNVEVVAQDTSGANEIDFLLVHRHSGLEIYKVSADEFERLLNFPLTQPQIIEKNFVFDSTAQTLQIRLLGGSFEKIFDYDQIFHLQTDPNNLETICSIDFNDADINDMEERFWKLENSLSKIDYPLDEVQINVIQNTNDKFVYTQSFKDYDKDVLLIYKEDSGATVDLQMGTYSFANYTLPRIYLSDFNLDFSNVDNTDVIFNDVIESARLVNINIIGNLDNVNIDINGVEEVFIHTLNIDGITVTGKSALKIEGSTKVYVENFNVNNVNFVGGSLVEFTNIEYLTIKNFSVTNCNLDSESLKIVQFIQIFELDFRDITVSGNTYTGDQASTFIYSGGIESSYINDITFEDNVLLSFFVSKNFYDYNKKTITLTKDLSNIETGSFNRNTMVNGLVDFTGYRIRVTGLTFVDNSCTGCNGAAIYFSDCQFVIGDSIFRENSAMHGGGVYLVNTKPSWYNRMYGCTFADNTAIGSGGAIHLQNSDLIFDGENGDSSVTGNSAKLGGGIRYLEKVPNFVANSSTNSSNRRSLQTTYPNLALNTNTASVMGNNIGSYPASLKVSSVTQSIEEDSPEAREADDPIQLIYSYNGGQMASGNIMKINITFYDEENNLINVPADYQQQADFPQSTIDELHEYSLKIFGNNTEIELEGDIYKSPSSFQTTDDQTRYVVDEMVVHSIPGISNFYYITSPSIRQIQDGDFAEGPFVIKVTVSFRQCIVGEILDGKHGRLKRCYECPHGKYSLANPADNQDKKCNPCPYQATDCYGSVILLKNGYWRETNTTDLIEECKNRKDNCKAEEIVQSEEIKWGDNICSKGHIGPLCEECDTYGEKWETRYKKDPNYTCLSCDKTGDTNFILPIVLFVVFIIAYIIFAIRVALRLSANISLGYYLRKSRWISVGTSAVKDYSPFNIKQFMHYLQISRYANTYYFGLPTWVTFIPDLISVPIEFVMNSLDCAATKVDGIPIVYIRAIFSLIIPVMYVVVCLMIYLFLVCIRKLRHSKNYMFNGMTFLMLFLQPGEVQILIQVVSCRSIGGKNYITADLNYECYTSQHMYYIFVLILPALILWMLIIPGWIFFGLVKSARKQQLDNCIVRFKYGFLYQEFKYKYFYWEYVRLYKKLFIVIVNSFYNAHNETKLIITGLAILSYYVISKKIQPYALPKYNNLDHWSMRIIMVLIYLNLLMEHNQVEWIKILAFILIIGLNQGWFLYLFFIVIWTKFLHVYGNHYNDAKGWIIKKIPCLKKIIKVEQRQTMKVFENWKKARTLGRDLAARRIKQLQQTNFYEAVHQKQENDKLIGEDDDNDNDNNVKSGGIGNKVFPEPKDYGVKKEPDSASSSQMNLKGASGLLSGKSKKQLSSFTPKQGQMELENQEVNLQEEEEQKEDA